MSCYPLKFQFVFLASLTIIHGACVSRHGAIEGRGSARKASLTSIDVTLPDSSILEARDQRVRPLINERNFGARIVVEPSDPVCVSATRIDQASKFEVTVRLAVSIAQGCDYLVTVELGQTGPDGRISVVMFRNQPALAIHRSEIQGKATFQANIVLKAVTGQQPSNQAFPAAKDSEFLDAFGNNTRLSSIFRGSYLLLDFSQPGCGACVSLAQELSESQEFLDAFASENSKCSMATVVPESQRGGWMTIFPAVDIMGRHSVFPAGGFSDVAGKFGERISATPTFLLIDRDGNVVGKSAGGLPDNAMQLCR